MFRTNVPVTASAFHNRQEQLTELESAVQDLARGNPRWLALLGSRKIGKTSLLLELERRHRSQRLVFAVIDSFEERPVSLSIFRRYALRIVDGFFSRQTGVSLESLAARPDEYRSALFDAVDFVSLPRSLRTTLLALAEQQIDRAFVETALRLPEMLAEELDSRCFVAWDEFQELADLTRKRNSIDFFALSRAIWQRHERVGYLISGSRRSMLLELVSSPASPFFQHFSIIEVGPMRSGDAIELLVSNAPKSREIPLDIAQRAVDTLGGHPFYLQLFGETLTRTEPPYDAAAFKGAMSELLFSRTGRLSLYFQREYDKLVGRATTSAAVLSALADGPLKLTEVAAQIQASTGSTARYLERLKDGVARLEDGRYAIVDPVFSMWVRWSKPGGTVVPMAVIGDEAELAVARALAEMGFELVYQSRASRGAFDLLALRAGRPLGIQVKHTTLPLRFKKTEWNRMKADAKRFDWSFVVAVVGKKPPGRVQFLDPALARITRAVILDESTLIENLLAWM